MNGPEMLFGGLIAFAAGMLLLLGVQTAHDSRDTAARTVCITAFSKAHNTQDTLDIIKHNHICADTLPEMKP